VTRSHISTRKASAISKTSTKSSLRSPRSYLEWNPPHLAHSDEYLRSKYRYRDPDGRVYRLDNMTSPNRRPNMMYEWKGHASPALGWRYERATMERLDAEGRIWYPDSTGKRPQLKRYLDEMAGTLATNVWTDIAPINSQAKERLGYPTQKPLAPLERILAAASIRAMLSSIRSVAAARRLWPRISSTGGGSASTLRTCPSPSCGHD
jgi:hypothetical protein